MLELRNTTVVFQHLPGTSDIDSFHIVRYDPVLRVFKLRVD